MLQSYILSIACLHLYYIMKSTGVRVELTSSRRVALHRYTFPASSKEPRIVVDITNDGQQSSTNPSMNIDPDTGRVTGA